MPLNKRNKIAVGILIVCLVAIAAVFSLSSARSKVESALSTLKSSKDNFVSSITSALSGASALHQSAVIELTNEQRKANGDVGTLTEDTKLDAAAKAKLDDMFKRQYFDHTSPDGHGPSYVVDNAGYSYVVIGENLALGNFKDDTALVAAWMASPGHRANILNKDFSDIGVAVGQGMYQGSKVWMAVQEFGRPLSACPSISSELKSQIETDRATTDSESTTLASDRQQLDTMPRSTSAQETAYNQKISEYNSLVKQYNAAVASLKSEIASYNAQVVAFNACLKK